MQTRKDVLQKCNLRDKENDTSHGYVMFVYRNCSSIKKGCTTTITSPPKIPPIEPFFFIPNFHHTTVIFTHLFTHDSIQQNLFHPQPTHPTNSTNPTIQLNQSNHTVLRILRILLLKPPIQPTNQPTHTLRILCMWRVAIKSGLAI